MYCCVSIRQWLQKCATILRYTNISYPASLNIRDVKIEAMITYRLAVDEMKENL